MPLTQRGAARLGTTRRDCPGVVVQDIVLLTLPSLSTYKLASYDYDQTIRKRRPESMHKGKWANPSAT